MRHPRRPVVAWSGATRTGTPRDDHRRARTLAEALARVDGVVVGLDLVQTNLVVAHLDPRFGESPEGARRLGARGLRMLPYSGGRLRAVTHRGIDDDDIARATELIRTELG